MSLPLGRQTSRRGIRRGVPARQSGLAGRASRPVRRAGAAGAGAWRGRWPTTWRRCCARSGQRADGLLAAGRATAGLAGRVQDAVLALLRSSDPADCVSGEMPGILARGRRASLHRGATIRARGACRTGRRAAAGRAPGGVPRCAGRCAPAARRGGRPGAARCAGARAGRGSRGAAGAAGARPARAGSGAGGGPLAFLGRAVAAALGVSHVSPAHASFGRRGRQPASAGSLRPGLRDDGEEPMTGEAARIAFLAWLGAGAPRLAADGRGLWRRHRRLPGLPDPASRRRAGPRGPGRAARRPTCAPGWPPRRRTVPAMPRARAICRRCAASSASWRGGTAWTIRR